MGDYKGSFKDVLRDYRQSQVEAAIWEDIAEHLRSKKEKPIYDDNVGTIRAADVRTILEYIEGQYIKKLHKHMAKIEGTEVEGDVIESQGSKNGEVEQAPEKRGSRGGTRGRGKGKVRRPSVRR